MNSFTLSLADLRAVTGWGAYRARSIFRQPYLLAHLKDPPSVHGGGRTLRFRLGDILIRCRQKASFTRSMAKALIDIDQARRASKSKPNDH